MRRGGWGWLRAVQDALFVLAILGCVLVILWGLSGLLTNSW